MSWGYGELATEVYDIDKPIGSSFGDVELYRELLSGIDGRVLEPAVGTGRILIPLLEAGLTVEGYDNSPEMLERCRRNCAERGLSPALSEADMTSFTAAEPYAAVIVPTGSITLLCGRDTVLRALAGFRDCLRPGGRLLVDVPPPALVHAHEPMRSWSVGASVLTLQVMHLEYDPVANETTRWLRYERWVDGSLEATELQIFRLAQWSLTEFTGLLERSGFVDVTVSADGPTPASEIWTFSARCP